MSLLILYNVCTNISTAEHFQCIIEITFIFHIVSVTNGLQDHKSHATVMSRRQQSYAKFISIFWKKLASRDKDLNAIRVLSLLQVIIIKPSSLYI